MPAVRTLIVALAMLAVAAAASAQQVEVLWLGHSTYRITTPTGKVIVVDPFFRKNPRTPAKYKDLEAIGKVDVILVTHGHPDHISDLPELAKLTGALVIANYELANNLLTLNILEGNKTIALNKGGTVIPLAGTALKVHMVPAEHSSSIDLPAIKPDWTGPRFFEGGVAVGYVIELENGLRIYHSGDTDAFGDMALIGKYFKPDIALVCIGGHFTMGPERAAYALRELIKPKIAVPMHYGTFPAINRTPAELKAALGNAPIKMVEMKPGEPMKF
ncbi:MAG: metal-dependent hydrolase [Burkholderiales bacterium]